MIDILCAISKQTSACDIVTFTFWQLDIYWCAISKIIVAIDLTTHTAYTLWSSIGREIVGHLPSLSVRTGDVERDVDQSIDDNVELRQTLSVLKIKHHL